MDGTVPQLLSKTLRRSNGKEDYDVYRAGLEWSLTDPIIIDSKDDLLSEARWRGRVEPFEHQVRNLINFCRRLPVTLLADDVGLGKTISAGLVASELVARRRVSKILIVAPKLLGQQWKEELEAKFAIPAQLATGRALLDMDSKEEVSAVITTYNSARLYLDRIPQDRFQMLVLDEAHKLRNLYGVDNPPQVALRFRQALQERRFKYVLMLTATPIQNRLWDLYSLLDLLTVARGHENPFGSKALFARNFIADKAKDARHLHPYMRNQFRSIVYGYMSRVRRGDANLHFPDRSVVLQQTTPTSDELRLIDMIREPIQKLNRLAQISILQALTSSPQALAAQLEKSARNGTVPQELAHSVRAVVRTMPISAKLKGLASLVSRLRQEKPRDWRMVIFTGRRETQATIESYLISQGVTVSLINGDTSARNAETLANFRTSPPAINVIVSTEAGSEGVNLQVANVLVNFDLPWNPMIVEQRIGRIQRLASEHAKVSIYNVILAGTFEEYIVGRLMEKLQTISHAIGDVEALLEASGMDDGGDDGIGGFEEQIRRLVLDSLAGKDVEAAARLAEQSIEQAKATLETEEYAINELLGNFDDTRQVGPRAPSLPPISRSMTAAQFTLRGLAVLGARIESKGADTYTCIVDGQKQTISTSELEPEDNRMIRYAPGTAAFERLVSRVTQTGTHDVNDIDAEPRAVVERVSLKWMREFGGQFGELQIIGVTHCFEGNALVRARVTVAHDAYERLVNVRCVNADHRIHKDTARLTPIGHVIEDPAQLGVNQLAIAECVLLDTAIVEFRRFYLERRDMEIAAALQDERKRKKLEDDFTPRLEATIVGLDGIVNREVTVRLSYRLHGGSYASTISIVPCRGSVIAAPELARCLETGTQVPEDCLEHCVISQKRVLRHLLVAADISGRLALPAHVVVCGLSGKRVLSDEVERSAVTGRLTASVLLRTSSVSGRRAEPSNFQTCDFTGSSLLADEKAISDVSGKTFRSDQLARSVVSGKCGHQSEFIVCPETGKIFLPGEGERCAATGKLVVPGLLEECSISKQRVLPSELERSAASGRKALPRYLVRSSVSNLRILGDEALQAADGTYCSMGESRPCVWSGRRFHPTDIRTCAISGISFHVHFATSNLPVRLLPLVKLLDNSVSQQDEVALWPKFAQAATVLLRSKVKIEAATLAPDGRHLAVAAELRTYLGLRVQHVGFVSSKDGQVIGRIAIGKRNATGWKVSS